VFIGNPRCGPQAWSIAERQGVEPAAKSALSILSKRLDNFQKSSTTDITVDFESLALDTWYENAANTKTS
jgi:hypothetical protein